MSDLVNIGDVILARIEDSIEQVEINDISPSGKHLLVESEEWIGWIRLLDYLETLEAAEYDDGDGESDDDEPDLHIEVVDESSGSRWSTGRMKP